MTLEIIHTDRCYIVVDNSSVDLADACAARDAMSADRQALAAELAQTNAVLIDETRAATMWTGIAQERGDELAQARKELAHAKVKANQLRGVDAELADARRVALSYLRMATDHKKELAQARVVAKDNRDYWYDKAIEAEAERDKARKEAQRTQDELAANAKMLAHQCDLAREAETEAEGLRRQLAEERRCAKRLDAKAMRLEMERDRLLDECDTLQAELYNAAEGEATIVKAAEVLLSQEVRELEAAKTLLSPQRRKYLVLNEDYKNLQDALEYRSKAAAQLLERLATLDAAEKALAGCGIGGIYDTFNGLPDAIEQMAESIKELEDRMGDVVAERQARKITKSAAHLLSKALDECTQTVATERAQRLEAETSELAMIKMLSGERQLRYMAEQRATRAEALAQLVTQETVELLERLAMDADAIKGNVWNMRSQQARNLAASIREALALEADE